MDDKLKEQARAAYETDHLQDLEQYIQEHWIDPDGTVKKRKARLNAPDYEAVFRKESFSKGEDIFLENSESVSLDDLFGELGKPFHEVLFEKIAESGMTDVEVYKRANMDRKLFS